jgi:hypothetical protein
MSLFARVGDGGRVWGATVVIVLVSGVCIPATSSPAGATAETKQYLESVGQVEELDWSTTWGHSGEDAGSGLAQAADGQAGVRVLEL